MNTLQVTSLPIDRRLLRDNDEVCPFCGSGLVHHELPYRIEEESNRYMDRIPMWSELCHHHWELVIKHWKGSTEVYYARARGFNPKYK